MPLGPLGRAAVLLCRRGATTQLCISLGHLHYWRSLRAPIALPSPTGNRVYCSGSPGFASSASTSPPAPAPTALPQPITDVSPGGDLMAGVEVISESDWQHLGAHLAAYDEQREALIKKCRDMQKLAKQAVYSLHRGEAARAEQQLDKTESLARELLPALAKYPSLRPGSYSAAIEEYAEAKAFSVFLREGRLVRSEELPLAEPEEFLGGVLDFTGELNRYAVARATQRDRAAVQRCRDLVDGLMGRFLQFDLRNGSLRKKFDALKYTLKKMESTLYELALTEAMGFKVEAAGMEPDAAGGSGGGG
ncbi:hypothetical protein Agub_g5106, partial [Astrephomene gubernaculifera]